MKHQLLSLLAFACTVTYSASAWAIDEPQEVTPTHYPTEWATPEDGGIYFLENVGLSKYVGAGNDWGTHVVTITPGTGDDPIYPVNYWNGSISLSPGSTYILPVTLSKAENGWYIKHLGTTAATNNGNYLTSEDGNSWIDGNQSRGAIFILQPAEGVEGGYTIQATNTLDAGTYFGIAKPEEEVTEESVLNVMNDITSDNGYIVWRFIKTNYVQYNAYDARLALYNLITGDAATYNVNTAEAEAIYNNNAATVNELEEATHNLQVKVNKAIFAAQFNGTADDPQEVTSICLVNSDFSVGNINGWTCTFQKGVNANNVGYQGSSYTNNGTTLTDAGSATDDDGNPAYLNKFIEAWKSEDDPYVIGNAELSQTVYGLPAGMYKLTCDVIAVYQWTNPAGSNPVKGVKLFIQTDTGTEVYQEVATNDRVPEHFSITFLCPEGVEALTFGLKTENCTANWIGADNFRIYYYGTSESSPELLMLQEQIKTAEASDISEGDNANKEILAAYIKALEDAQATADKKDATNEEYAAATAALKEALATAQQSIKDYIKLMEQIDYAAELSEKAYNAGFEDASAAIDDLLDEWETAYEEGTATAEFIKTLEGVAYDTMMENLAGEIKPGTDITFLLNNPGFTTGTTTNPTGWTINNGSMTELRTSTHNIETYHKAFDLSQTLKQMPAGVYDVTLQGFARHDDANDTESTWLYGGITKAFLIDLDNDVEQKVTEENRNYVEGMTQMGDSNYDNSRGITMDDEGNTLYQCNGMTGAYYWFQATNPKTDELFYTNHVKVILDKVGDLTIGIHCQSVNDWVIFDNFALKYMGQDAEVLVAQLQEKLDEFDALVTSDDAFLSAEGTALADELPEKAQKAIDDYDPEAIIAMISEVSNAIDTIKVSNQLGKELRSAVEYYNSTAMDELNDYGLTPTDDSYYQLLEAWEEGGEGDAADLADNKAISDVIAQIKDGWVPFVMSAATEATKDEPINVTPIIYNPNYVDPITIKNSDNGWTSMRGDTLDITPGLAFNQAEFFNTNFNHYQTIKGLTPGFYIVTVDAYYRAGDYAVAVPAQIADTLAYNTIMYATTNGTTYQQPVKDIFAGAGEAAIGTGDVAVTISTGDVYIPNSMEGAETYLNSGNYTNTITLEVGEDGIMTIGLRKDTLITNDWTIFNNWTLTYLGSGEENRPEAVNDIQAAKGAAQTIYNLAGQKVEKVQKGIYIINGKKMVVK